MDRNWQEAAEFLADKNVGGKGAVAPTELAALTPIEFGYGNVGAANARLVKTLVLHKGRYQELDREFLKFALSHLTPVFANEVFIVFSNEGKSLATDHVHTGQLTTIRAWLENSSAGAPQPTKRSMAPVYIGDGIVLAETIHGHLILLPAGDRGIAPHIIRDGYFDINLTRFLERALCPGMVYVDVGANIGVYSLLAASLVGSNGRVIAIEPLPTLKTFLIDTFSMNGFDDRTRIFGYAVAESSGEITIHEFRRHPGLSSAVVEVARSAEQRISEKAQQVVVSAKSLSEIMSEAAVERADLIKIDVEGFELDVLRGAHDFLRASPGTAMMVEWSSQFMSEQRQADLHDFLTNELGGRIEAIEHNGLTRPIGLQELRSATHFDVVVRRN